VTDELRIRIQGSESLPTLIYLPGTHGDWTLNAGFREAARDRARLVEFTFPRTLTWSLEDYAKSVEEKLLQNCIRSGWILAESFASQVAWAWVGLGSKEFRMDGIILAGGFVRHPMIPAVRMAGMLARNIPIPVLNVILRCYTFYARARESDSPEKRAALREFSERRTKEDLLAAAHRLDLIAEDDLRPNARASSIPLYYLTGLIDPIVPWPFVRPWIEEHCPGFRGWRIIAGSDHHVLGAAKKSSEQILKWMAGPSTARPDS